MSTAAEVKQAYEEMVATGELDDPLFTHIAGLLVEAAALHEAETRPAMKQGLAVILRDGKRQMRLRLAMLGFDTEDLEPEAG